MHTYLKIAPFYATERKNKKNKKNKLKKNRFHSPKIVWHKYVVVFGGKA